MGNVAGEQDLALQQHFPYKFPYSFKTSDCHKISSFNDGGLIKLYKPPREYKGQSY